MSKKLVAWFGDSWNNPKLLAPSSNVLNLFRTLLGKDKSSKKLNGAPAQQKMPTIKLCDPGVGSCWWNKFQGGVTGKGLSRNIREGDKFLIDQYETWDEIYLFGFSRELTQLEALLDS